MTITETTAHVRATILVVDDTPQNLSLMSDLLESLYTVKLAPSGARALKIASTNPPDLILLDIMMPEIDGYEVCRTLKANPETSDIPVIFLTAMQAMEDEERGLQLGAVDYITKPISPPILLARVRNQLDLKAAADKMRQQNHLLEQERTKARELLHNILPVEIAEELSQTGKVKPVRNESVSILFTDFSGFTQASATMPADRMVSELNEIFSAFDDICAETGIEKIKTIGDAFMAVAGIPKSCDDHALRAVRAGIKMADYMAQRNQESAFKWGIRIGIHSGSVVSGVVGKRKYTYDIWGDAVNTASRMESSGEVGRVNISAYTYDLIRAEFDCEYRGKVEAKGKGPVDMYFVIGLKQAA
ncbi:MAG: adenylate/guanylate cyclase domain-containing protein [Rhodocyclaceae bacterium]|nr:adenylate/guanylate cyclase domain-containing protein [Rhodocyclaceae bacterium]MDZ4215106.1 adenylate/guanylate cyclase domain-containing protein [Rhodocyclaceae bacterium]